MTPYQRLFGSGPMILVQSLALMILAVWVQRETEFPRPPWPRWVGFGLGTITVLLGLRVCQWAIQTLPFGERGKSLTTGGPFRWVRHPLYAGLLSVVGLGTFLIGYTYLGLVAWWLSYVVAHGIIRYEEGLMKSKFGDEWVVYAERTPRFVPRLLRRRDTH